MREKNHGPTGPLGENAMSDTRDTRTKVPASFGRRSFLFAAAGTGAAGLAAISGAARAATPEEAAQASMGASASP